MRTVAAVVDQGALTFDFAIPCEVFTETGLEIKAKSPFRTTFTMELANGHYGYLPTPEQHALGGYETWMGTNLLETDASRKISAVILELLGRLSAVPAAGLAYSGSPPRCWQARRSIVPE